MIPLLVIVLSVAIALLRGGSISNLAQLGFRYGYLVLLGLILQLVIFSPWGAELGAHLTAPLYLLSLLIILVAVLLNYRLPGLPILGLGLLLNFTVILLNGGYMPASREALLQAGLTETLENLGRGGASTNSILMGEGTRLRFLADIFAIPSPLPLANIFSLGDILIAVGLFILVQRAMKR